MKLSNRASVCEIESDLNIIDGDGIVPGMYNFEKTKGRICYINNTSKDEYVYASKLYVEQYRQSSSDKEAWHTSYVLGNNINAVKRKVRLKNLYFRRRDENMKIPTRMYSTKKDQKMFKQRQNTRFRRKHETFSLREIRERGNIKTHIILSDNHDIFCLKNNKTPCMSDVYHKIEPDTTMPIMSKLYT